MKSLVCSRKPLVCLLVVCLALPGITGIAAEPVQQKTDSQQPTISTMTDIELAADGLLTGRVVDRRGHGLSNANVWVLKNDKISSQVVTDREGHFRVLGMTGGVYRLMTSEGAAICRAWNQGTAPPSARRSVLVVSGTQISAGNLASLKYWLADPLVVASITAIAVGVPVIMNNNDRNRKGS